MNRKSVPNIYKDIKSYFNKASEIIGLDNDVKNMLSYSNNEVTVNFPVKMDDGNIEMFTGYRVQHNNTLGPYHGTLRFHPTVNMGEMRALALWMTLKAALMNIPYGGSNGGIRFNPREYSFSELEKITRRFTFSLGDNIGPDYDITSPDINTGSQTIAWMMDTYLYTVQPQLRNARMHVVTGKPLELCGCAGCIKATGLGVVTLIEEWAKEKKFDLEGARFFVQGFGNVGYWTSKLLMKHNAVLVGIQNSTGSIYNENGLNPEDIINHLKINHTLKGYPSAEFLSYQDFFKIEAEMFIPAALENQITSQTAELLNVLLVAEGASGPTTSKGHSILRKRNIDVIPDILCNAGGLIVSYFEWLQNKRSEYWSENQVDRKLKKIMQEAYTRVKTTADEFKTDRRTAAYIVALKRLLYSYKNRGVFP